MEYQILKEEAIADAEVSAIKFTKNALENSVGIASAIMTNTAENQKKQNRDDIKVICTSLKYGLLTRLSGFNGRGDC